jgi:hypothetical protein
MVRRNHAHSRSPEQRAAAGKETSMSRHDRWQALAQAMRLEVHRHFPEWTDSNEHDPGLTLLELFAWLTENLAYRTPAMATREGAALAHRLASAAGVLATAGITGGPPTGPNGMRRVHYFFGQVLSAEDFLDEQNYFRSRLRRLNRTLHGVGVVTGLGVSIAGKGKSACVVIEPGAAIDAQGEEIEAPEAISIPLPEKGRALLVQIRYAERPCQPVPVVAPDDGADAQQYSRIVETYEALLSPTADAAAVTLARLRHAKGNWLVERRSMKRKRR